MSKPRTSFELLADIEAEYHHGDDGRLNQNDRNVQNDDLVGRFPLTRPDSVKAAYKPISYSKASQELVTQSTDRHVNNSESQSRPRSEQGISQVFSTKSGYIPIRIGEPGEAPSLPPFPDRASDSMGWLDDWIDQRQYPEYNFEDSSTRSSPDSPVNASRIFPIQPSRTVPRPALSRVGTGSTSKRSLLNYKPELKSGSWSAASSPTLGRFPSLLRGFRQEQAPK